MMEQFEHDDCLKCRVPSIPAENVADQTLRLCPNCGDEWFEDLAEPPKKTPTCPVEVKS